MKPPDIPAIEPFRVQALPALNILDTAAEQRFDRLTRNATATFDVPIWFELPAFKP